MKNRNIVLFSSGISECSGLLCRLAESLNKRGYVCEYWRNLFANANDEKCIALLPMLIKKIPTFDYAVLICEGHDVTMLQRRESVEKVKTMRDNVLFEIGLCVMALGANRTILITDEDVRLPDDLTGVGNQTALKRIVFSNRASEADIDAACEEVDRYICATGDYLSPVVIGAASSTACGYVNNFVFRALEHIDEGVFFESDGKNHIYPIEKIYMHIVLPNDFDDMKAKNTQIYTSAFQKGSVPNARSRPVNLYFKTIGDELHIIDYPTTLVTSYDTACMILSLQADDKADPKASTRFIDKELNLYAATLRKLLKIDYLVKVIDEHYMHLSANEKSEMIKRVIDIVDNRLTIDYMR